VEVRWGAEVWTGLVELLVMQQMVAWLGLVALLGRQMVEWPGLKVLWVGLWAVVWKGELVQGDEAGMPGARDWRRAALCLEAQSALVVVPKRAVLFVLLLLQWNQRPACPGEVLLWGRQWVAAGGLVVVLHGAVWVVMLQGAVRVVVLQGAVGVVML
jgi:hypothetical protein